MRCYFLRHGIAADRDAWSGSDDDRPLTREGRARMENEARAIGDLALDLDAIVLSPLLRAKQTAEIVAERLKRTIVEDARLAEGFDADRLVEILGDRAGAEAVMLVGHEPSMSATIARLAGGAHIELKKGGLACVNLPDPSASAGTLLWLIPPKLLANFEKR